jgi:hypothetical protein
VGELPAVVWAINREVVVPYIAININGDKLQTSI